MENNNSTPVKRKILTKVDILTAGLCLIGCLPGLICWKDMPEQIPMHWGIDNQPNAWGSKLFVFLGLPLMMAALHLLCCAADNFAAASAATHPKAVKRIVRLIIPVITIVIECITVMYVMHLMTDIGLAVCLMMGVMLIVLGNYLPKSRPNRTFGIKLPWTIADEDVWHKTHRLGGWLYIIGGVILIAAAFFRAYIVGIVIMFIIVLIPVVYSFIISRRPRNKNN